MVSAYNVYDSKDAGIAAGEDIRPQSTAYTATDDGTLTTTGSASGGFANGTNSSTTVSGSGAAIGGEECG